MINVAVISITRRHLPETLRGNPGNSISNGGLGTGFEAAEDGRGLVDGDKTMAMRDGREIHGEGSVSKYNLVKQVQFFPQMPPFFGLQAAGDSTLPGDSSSKPRRSKLFL